MPPVANQPQTSVTKDRFGMQAAELRAAAATIRARILPEGLHDEDFAADLVIRWRWPLHHGGRGADDTGDTGAPLAPAPAPAPPSVEQQFAAAAETDAGLGAAGLYRDGECGAGTPGGGRAAGGVLWRLDYGAVGAEPGRRSSRASRMWIAASAGRRRRRWWCGFIRMWWICIPRWW